MLYRLFLSTPRRQAVTYLLSVAIIYFVLARPSGFARDVVVNGDYAYLAVEAQGLQLINVLDPAQPVQAGFVPVQDKATALDRQEHILYLADGSAGIKIYDTTIPAELGLIAAYNTPGKAQDIKAVGAKIYVADGNQGLQVLSFKPSDKGSIQPIAGYPTKNDAVSVTADSNRVFTGESKGHLTIFDASSPDKLYTIGTYEAGARINDILVQGNIAYLAASQRGVIALDVNNPAEIVELTVHDTPGESQGLSLAGTLLYVADGDGGLTVLDVSAPTQITTAGSHVSNGEAMNLVYREGFVYLANGNSGLEIISAQATIETEILGASRTSVNIENSSISGSLAYLAAGEQGLRVLDISDPAAPFEINQVAIPGYIADVVISGQLAYVAAKNQGMQVLDVSNPSAAISPVNQNQVGSDTYALAVTGGYAYLADGQSGLRIVEQSAPGQWGEIGAVDTPGNAEDIELLALTAYIADASGGLRIVDVADPANPREIGYYDTPGDTKAVAVSPETSSAAGSPTQVPIYAYLADGSRGLRILDVSNPGSPILVSSEESPGFVEDIVVSGKYAYLAAREQGMLVYDISDPTHPVLFSYVDTPGRALGITLSGSTVYISDFERGLRVLLISDLLNPVEVGFYDTPDQVVDVAQAGTLAYVTDGQHGLWTLSTSDPSAIRESGFEPTHGTAEGVTLSEGYAFVADGDAGVQIINISAPPAMYQTGTITSATAARDVHPVGATAYIANGVQGIQIADVGQPSTPFTIGSISLPGDAQGIATQGSFAYLASGFAGLQVVNVTNPQQPTQAGVLAEIHDARAVALGGDYAYVAGGGAGLLVADISQPVAPKLIATLPTDYIVQDLAYVQPYAFLAEGQGGIEIVDLTNPTQPSSIGVVQFGGDSQGIDALIMAAQNGAPESYRIYVAAGDHKLVLLEGQKQIQITPMGTYETSGTATFNQIRDYVIAQLTGTSNGLSTKAANTVQQIIFDWLVIGLGGFLLWLVFFAQFTLPVSTYGERAASINRLGAFLRGRHGPALHVLTGKVVGGSTEGDRKGPGVVLIDLSSAVVFSKRVLGSSPGILISLWRRANRLWAQVRGRTDNNQVPLISEADQRVAGPGLIFTGVLSAHGKQFDESVQGVADLRPQIRRVDDVHGYTLDGIELTTSVYAIFTLGQPPQILQVTYSSEHTPENLRVIHTMDKVLVEPDTGNPIRRVQLVKSLADELDDRDKSEIHRYIHSADYSLNSYKNHGVNTPSSSTPYEFSPQRVFAAVASEAQDAQKREKRDWTELPAAVAVDIFRDLIGRQIYDDLYKPAEPDIYPLQDMKAIFSKQIQNQGVLAFQYVERSDGLQIECDQEWKAEKIRLTGVRELKQPKVLRARGIKVIGAGFGELKPVNKAVYQQRLENWRARWERDEISNRLQYDALALRIRNEARNQGQRELAERLTFILRTGPHSQSELAQQVFKALDAAAANPATRKLLPHTTIDMLDAIGSWLIVDDETGADVDLV